VEVMASLSQGRTAAAQCGLFTHKSVPVIFEPPCSYHNAGGDNMSLKNFHVFILLICCAVYIGLLPVFQENLLFPHSRITVSKKVAKA